jgi:thiamine biosynthesis lipoprotein
MATDYSDTSEVGRINAAAGIESVAVSSELIALLRLGLQFGEVSHRAFDVAVGPIVKAWDFLSPNPRSPSKEDISALLPLINSQLISIAGNKVFLRKKRMGIDLGGIAKGYAVDRSTEVLLRGGFSRFIIDIGGNLGVNWEGTHMLDSTVAEILIRHPRRDGEFFGKFMMGTGGVSTSGDYQRYFIENGIRYHHIIDPVSGYPSRGVVSVTIVAPDATSADALSTLVFVLGREKGMDFIKNTPDVEGMIIHESGDTLAYDLSPGFQRRFVRITPHD